MSALSFKGEDGNKEYFLISKAWFGLHSLVYVCSKSGSHELQVSKLALRKACLGKEQRNKCAERVVPKRKLTLFVPFAIRGCLSFMPAVLGM